MDREGLIRLREKFMSERERAFDFSDKHRNELDFKIAILDFLIKKTKKVEKSE